MRGLEKYSGLNLSSNDNQILKANEILELAVYKNIDKNPFFKHSVTENLKILTDTALDIVKPINRELGQTKNYNTYIEWVKGKELSDEERNKHRTSFEEAINKKGSTVARAKRKRSKAVCVLKEGSGKIKVNHRDFIEYFSEFGHRYESQ